MAVVNQSDKDHEISGLAWELPYAVGAALGQKKKKKKNKAKKKKLRAYQLQIQTMRTLS